MTEGRRKSMLDSTRNNNFLRQSFGTVPQPNVLTREEYLLVLRREREQWKTLSKDKKKQLLRKQPDLVIKREDVFVSLSDDDRAFLNSRPNYHEIVQFAQRYVQSVLHYNKIAINYKQLHETIIDDIHEEIDAIIDEILLEENERCLICANGFCTKELHPLLDEDKQLSSVISEMVDLQIID